ncbi:MAG: glycosyltransferase family 2 protein [Phycisphaerales bacterium]
MLATRNRKDELRRAIRSCLMQSVPVEVIVRDDGSTDGTDEMVHAEFPTVNYARHPEPRGSIINRNDAVSAARSPIIFSIDDDAAFESPRTVEQTLREFDHPRVGIVAIPFVDVLLSPRVQQSAPDGTTGPFILDTFRGCAAAWRKDLFLALGGYRPVLKHMAEEPDLALRALNAGYVVLAGRADAVHHYESAARSRDAVFFQIARNGVLQGWMNAPLLMLLPHLTGSALASLRAGVRLGRLGPMIHGVARGFADVLLGRAARRPVSRRAYFLTRWLRAHKPVALTVVEGRLPALMPLEQLARSGAHVAGAAAVGVAVA